MNIGFYNDSRIHGGHEMMTIMLANALAETHNIIFYYYQPALGERLNPQIRRVRIPYYSQQTLASLNSLLRVHQAWDLSRRFKSDRLDMLIVSQGMIELGTKGLLAAKFAGIRVASYLPLAFSLRATGGKLARVRDLGNRLIYRAFDAFITISKSQENLIRKQVGLLKPIHIVENLISVSSLNKIPEVKSNDLEKIRIASIGRIEFRQKGQDKLIPIALCLKERNASFQIDVIGDGPDLPRLQSLVQQHNLEDCFKFRGWIEDKKAIYRGIDLTLSTSNYEGVPLNLLESLGNSIPCVSPDQEIFREYLPNAYIYRNASECAEKIIEIWKEKSKLNSINELLRQRVLDRHSDQRFISSAQAAIGQAFM